MRKLIAIVMMLFPMLAWAQNSIPQDSISYEIPFSFEAHFRINENGFTNAQNPSRDFTVLLFPNKSANDLYNKVYTLFASKFSSPKDNISPVPNSLISIRAIATKSILSKGNFCDVEFTFSIEVKDGKVRFNYPIINQIWILSDFGRLKCNERAFKNMCREDSTIYLQDYFNSLIDEIADAINEKGIDNDW